MFTSNEVYFRGCYSNGMNETRTRERKGSGNRDAHVCLVFFRKFPNRCGAKENKAEPLESQLSRQKFSSVCLFIHKNIFSTCQVHPREHTTARTASFLSTAYFLNIYVSRVGRRKLWENLLVEALNRLSRRRSEFKSRQSESWVNSRCLLKLALKHLEMRIKRSSASVTIYRANQTFISPSPSMLIKV